MKLVGILLAVVLALALVLGGGLVALSESGEVVVLRTLDTNGVAHETRLWVIDQGDEIWIRAGDPGSRWLARLRHNPNVELTRDDETRPYRAVPAEAAETRDRINAQLEAKYGFAHRVMDAIADYSAAVPIRLDPRD